MVDLIAFLSQFNQIVLVAVILGILVFEVFLFSFPKEVVMVYAGLVFGVSVGTIINLVGLFGAAWLGFVGGLGGRSMIEKLREHRLVMKYQEWLDIHGIPLLVALRLFPLTPNDIVSISSGFTEMKKTPYLAVSFFTAIPYALIWAYVGSNGLGIVREYFPEIYSPVTWVTGFAIVLVFFVILIRFTFTVNRKDTD